MHRKEHLYVPEILSGHLLIGSNFDDNERRLTGGAAVAILKMYYLISAHSLVLPRVKQAIAMDMERS
jgi:hypothetical protein